jgi:hypothetical protein
MNCLPDFLLGQEIFTLSTGLPSTKLETHAKRLCQYEHNISTLPIHAQTHENNIKTLSYFLIKCNERKRKQ